MGSNIPAVTLGGQARLFTAISMTQMHEACLRGPCPKPGFLRNCLSNNELEVFQNRDDLLCGAPIWPSAKVFPISAIDRQLVSIEVPEAKKAAPDLLGAAF